MDVRIGHLFKLTACNSLDLTILSKLKTFCDIGNIMNVVKLTSSVSLDLTNLRQLKPAFPDEISAEKKAS